MQGAAVPDETPNAETLEAFAELDNGGGHRFSVGDTFLGMGQSKYLTGEVSGGFTGTVIGLYAVGNNTAEFENFSLDYKKSE